MTDYINATKEQHSIVWEALVSYCRWHAMGEPKVPLQHGEPIPAGANWHDQYKSHIAYEGAYIWSFSIQTYDSPEGDTWMRGKVDWRGFDALNFVKLTFYHY